MGKIQDNTCHMSYNVLSQFKPIIVQQDATIYSLFVSVNRSTCFGWYLHPSSGAHVTVSTAYGISKPVTATCCERDWTGTCSRPVMLDNYWHIFHDARTIEHKIQFKPLCHNFKVTHFIL